VVAVAGHALGRTSDCLVSMHVCRFMHLCVSLHSVCVTHVWGRHAFRYLHILAHVLYTTVALLHSARYTVLRLYAPALLIL
jgi:hypothetical protein